MAKDSSGREVFSVDADGSVEALFEDGMGLEILGKQRIERATLIEQNFDTQLFDVAILPSLFTHECMQNFDTYKEANEWEKTFVNSCIQAGFNIRSIPHDADVLAIAIMTRKEMDDTKQFLKP